MHKNRLKKVLELKGITGSEFADIVGVNRVTIYEIMNNNRQMSGGRIYAWAVILKVSPLDLIEPTEIKPILPTVINSKL